MSDWKVFQGNGTPDPKAITRLPKPPKWRRFGDDQNGATKKQQRGQTFQVIADFVVGFNKRYGVLVGKL